MVRTSSWTCFAAVLTLLLAGPESRADPIQWSYGGGLANGVLPANDHTGLEGIVPASGLVFRQESGSAQVPAASFYTVGVHLIFRDSPTKVFMDIRDTASHAEGFLYFPMVFNGITDLSTKTSTVTATFLAPTTQSVVLGENRYTVTIGPYHPLTWKPIIPGNGSGEFDGSVDAQVNVSPASSPATTPEPSCLVLAGMGLVTVAGAAWRRRRRQKVSYSHG